MKLDKKHMSHAVRWAIVQRGDIYHMEIYPTREDARNKLREMRKWWSIRDLSIKKCLCIYVIKKGK